MSRVKKNFVANLAGSGWTALTGLICTPLYIRFLGMEAYGLIGFYFMMQGIIQILDMGLSPTMNREMARYSVLPEKAGEARDFVRTLEVGYWSIGLLIGLVLFLCAPLIATSWIKPGALPPEAVVRAVRIMGLLSALQWPMSFYHGGLLGLQRQVLFNAIAIAIATLASFGAVLVLWRFSPTVTAFFGWQVAVVALQVSLTTAALWRCLPASGRRPRFDPALVRNIWKFAAGMSGITVTALILMQLDKVVLSKLLDLKVFGYYVLAGVVGNGLSAVIIVPMFNTIFPRFCTLVATNDDQGLLEMYHGATQVMAVLLFPIAAVLGFFSHDVMLLWTRDAGIAAATAPIVSLLVAGTALNGMSYLPYTLQIASGWTRVSLGINSASILLLVPAILFMATRYGAIGAAVVWVALNGIYLLFGVPLTHSRLLKGEALAWLGKDFALPLGGSLFSVFLCKSIFTVPTSLVPGAAVLACIWLVACAATAVAAPSGRAWLRSRVRAA